MFRIIIATLLSATRIGAYYSATVLVKYILKLKFLIVICLFLVKITELFDKCKDKLTKRALVLGPPGIGKTTFCQYIAYKWSKYELFQQFKCLIYIRLRNLTSKLYPLRSSESYSLTDIIERECFRTYPLENHEERNVLKHMLDDASNVLWLLDGYDELNVPDHLDWFMRER
ncbi:unnamed protein product, partial [Rotaria magnacalcarata]